MEVIQIKCPGCQAVVSTGQEVCEYCGDPIVIRNMATIAQMPLPKVNKYVNVYRQTLAQHPESKDVQASLGTCFLRLKMYDRALEAFEKAMPDNFENAQPFFLAAVSLLQGKKPFVTPRPKIDKALEYLEAATMIEANPVFYYFMAYIRYDYHERHFLNTSPNYKETFSVAQDAGLSETDIQELHAILGTDIPQW